MERTLAELERERRAAEAERVKWERFRQEAEAAAAAQKEGAARWALSEKEIQKKVRQKVAEAVAEARSEIAGLMASLKGARDPALVKKGKESLAEIERRAGERGAPATPSLSPAPEPGKPVEIVTLGKRGILLDPPQGAKRVRVQVDRQILSVSPDALQRVEEEGAAPPPAPPSLAKGAAGSAELTLDLIGQRVEEGIVQLERFLDQAMLSGEREVRLVHGHGSGRLKKALREYLSTSPYIERFRPGDLLEGGDAVTVATLKEG